MAPNIYIYGIIIAKLKTRLPLFFFDKSSNKIV